MKVLLLTLFTLVIYASAHPADTERAKRSFTQLNFGASAYASASAHSSVNVHHSPIQPVPVHHSAPIQPVPVHNIQHRVSAPIYEYPESTQITKHMIDQVRVQVPITYTYTLQQPSRTQTYYHVPQHVPSYTPRVHSETVYAPAVHAHGPRRYAPRFRALRWNSATGRWC